VSPALWADAAEAVTTKRLREQRSLIVGPSLEETAASASPVLVQVLLRKTRIEVYVELYEWNVADAEKAMDLARLDDQNVAWASLLLFSIDSPASPTLSHKYHLVIRMAMATGSAARWGVDEIR
jgi:hypothetical protein